jgi:predicted O-linked N-acetylglucosamine transferase (SPINDLY family)
VRLLWAQILARLPNARLLVVGVPDGHARSRLVGELAGLGVDPARVSLRPYLAMNDYFRAFDAVDIALDTLPYSGGTTTCDALWMGVPVITLPGSRSSSRSAASILSTVGLHEWIAETPDEYVRLAVGFACDADQLAAMRKSLRGRLMESPLMDEMQFARDLETVYREMWRAWCEGSLQ